MTDRPLYNAVPAQVDLTAMEHDVLAFWRDNKVFARSVEQSAGRPEWVFYEGPPTANGKPGTRPMWQSWHWIPFLHAGEARYCSHTTSSLMPGS